MSDWLGMGGGDSTDRHLHALVVGALLATLGLIVAFALAASASAGADAERARWRTAATQAQAVARTLADLPVAREGAPQPDRVATVARRAMVASGIPQEAFAGLQPLGDTPLPGGGWHRQQVLIQMRGLTTPQAAGLVAALARCDPAWAVTAIQLSHTGPGDRYDAGLAVTTLYPATP